MVVEGRGDDVECGLDGGRGGDVEDERGEGSLDGESGGEDGGDGRFGFGQGS